MIFNNVYLSILSYMLLLLFWWSKIVFHQFCLMTSSFKSNIALVCFKLPYMIPSCLEMLLLVKKYGSYWCTCLFVHAVLGLNPKPHIYKASTLPLSYIPSPDMYMCVWVRVCVFAKIWYQRLYEYIFNHIK